MAASFREVSQIENGNGPKHIEFVEVGQGSGQERVLARARPGKGALG
jgi:hypothetical protein